MWQIPYLHNCAQICARAKTDIALDLLSVAMTVNATFAQHLHLGAKIMGSLGFKGHLQMSAKYVIWIRAMFAWVIMGDQIFIIEPDCFA